MITSVPQLRRFFLVRHQDETGVSGVGVVAGGIMWPDGTACLRWFTPTTSAAFYNSIADVEAIHGHGGKTEVIFADGPEVQRPACMVCGGGYLGGFCTDCGANGCVATVPEWVVAENLKYRNLAIEAERTLRGEGRKVSQQPTGEVMQKIDQVHHDGLGLNDRITIWADERDPDAGGASHRYTANIDTGKVDDKGVAIHLEVLDIQFQHGPRNVEESTSGVTEAAVLAVLIDRMRGFQAGPFACRENALVLTKLEEALQWLGHRARERHRRGVLGTNQK